MATPFTYYKSMGKFLDLKAAYSVVSGPIWPKFETTVKLAHGSRFMVHGSRFAFRLRFYACLSYLQV